MANLADIRQRLASEGITRVDLRVTDLPGRWHHFSIPASRLTEESAVNGFGFDGSSIRGFQPIEESDMLLIPDLETAVVDPSEEVRTLALICDVVEPRTGERYARDPRRIAALAEMHLRSTGIADTANFGPELEFFLFDDVRFQQSANTAFFTVDSVEASWNTGQDDRPNLGGKIGVKEGYAPTPPFDHTSGVRWAISEALERAGIEVEVHHHEVAGAGQGEIATRYASLRRKADETQWYKHLVRNIAQAHGKTATFMPKPIFGDNGSGMHTHQSLWKDGAPLFHDANGYAGLSQAARWYIGGLLTHAPALLAFCAPTTNSYRRLLPGFEAPVNLAYSARNRSVAVRIPTYSSAAAATRIEFRPPDGMCNPYLAFAAMLMAGLDGIRKQIDPGDPLDRNIYELKPDEAVRVPRVPGSLEAALDALAADQAFLLEGAVFTEELVARWIAMKREEAQAASLRPTPFEYEMYFNG